MEAWRDRPPTKKQTDRIKWWAAKIGVKCPQLGTSGQASDLIDKWKSQYPELEVEWHKLAEALSTAEEFKLDQSGALKRAENMAENYRGLHGCDQVPREVTLSTIKRIGSKRHDEKTDEFADRFFGYVKKCHPELFGMPHAPPVISHSDRVMQKVDDRPQIILVEPESKLTSVILVIAFGGLIAVILYLEWHQIWHQFGQKWWSRGESNP